MRAWLFGDIDRERLLDMDRKIAPARRDAMIVLASGAEATETTN